MSEAIRRTRIRARADMTEKRVILSPSNTRFNGRRWPAEPAWSDCDWDGAWIDPGPSPAGNKGPYLKVNWHYGKFQSPPDDEILVARVYPIWFVGGRIGRGTVRIIRLERLDSAWIAILSIAPNRPSTSSPPSPAVKAKGGEIA